MKRSSNTAVATVDHRTTCAHQTQRQLYTDSKHTSSSSSPTALLPSHNQEKILDLPVLRSQHPSDSSVPHTYSTVPQQHLHLRCSRIASTSHLHLPNNKCASHAAVKTRQLQTSSAAARSSQTCMPEADRCHRVRSRRRGSDGRRFFGLTGSEVRCATLGSRTLQALQALAADAIRRGAGGCFRERAREAMNWVRFWR